MNLFMISISIRDRLLVSSSLLSKRKMTNTSFFSRQKVFPSTKLLSLYDPIINFKKKERMI